MSDILIQSGVIVILVLLIVFFIIKLVKDNRKSELFRTKNEVSKNKLFTNSIIDRQIWENTSKFNNLGIEVDETEFEQPNKKINDEDNYATKDLINDVINYERKADMKIYNNELISPYSLSLLSPYSYPSAYVVWRSVLLEKRMSNPSEWNKKVIKHLSDKATSLSKKYKDSLKYLSKKRNIVDSRIKNTRNEEYKQQLIKSRDTLETFIEKKKEKLAIEEEILNEIEIWSGWKWGSALPGFWGKLNSEDFKNRGFETFYDYVNDTYNLNVTPAEVQAIGFLMEGIQKEWKQQPIGLRNKYRLPLSTNELDYKRQPEHFFRYYKGKYELKKYKIIQLAGMAWDFEKPGSPVWNINELRELKKKSLEFNFIIEQNIDPRCKCPGNPSKGNDGEGEQGYVPYTSPNSEPTFEYEDEEAASYQPNGSLNSNLGDPDSGNPARIRGPSGDYDDDGGGIGSDLGSASYLYNSSAGGGGGPSKEQNEESSVQQSGDLSISRLSNNAQERAGPVFDFSDAQQVFKKAGQGAISDARQAFKKAEQGATRKAENILRNYGNILKNLKNQQSQVQQQVRNLQKKVPQVRNLQKLNVHEPSEVRVSPNEDIYTVRKGLRVPPRGKGMSSY